MKILITALEAKDRILQYSNCWRSANFPRKNCFILIPGANIGKLLTQDDPKGEFNG